MCWHLHRYALVYNLPMGCSRPPAWRAGRRLLVWVNKRCDRSCENFLIVCIALFFSLDLTHLGPAAQRCCLTENLFKEIKGKCWMNNLDSCQYRAALGGPQKHDSNEQEDMRIRLEQWCGGRWNTLFSAVKGLNTQDSRGPKQFTTQKCHTWY